MMLNFSKLLAEDKNMMEGLPSPKTLEHMVSSTFTKKNFVDSVSNTSFLFVSFVKHQALIFLDFFDKNIIAQSQFFSIKNLNIWVGKLL